MSTTARESSTLAGQDGLDHIHAGQVHCNLAPAAFIELALARGEGVLTDTGAFTATTGAITGRSPKDRYLVAEPGREDDIDWGTVNRAMPPDVFERLHARVRDYLSGRELFVADVSACADPRYRLPVRVIADKAWHALFAQCLLQNQYTTNHDEWVTTDGHSTLKQPAAPQMNGQQSSRWTIVVASGMQANPAVDGTRSGVFVVLNLAQRIVLIGGSQYAGEIKKSVFSVLNYLLPDRGVFPMHCSANVGRKRDTALFFGLSGTGKTSLSADPERRLVGDDEHAWSDNGVFNIEGGCYAKCINLSREREPQIWDAIRFGSVLENVIVDPQSRRADFDDVRLTENTRAAYPIHHIAGAELSGMAGHPGIILFLACDAFGILPPVSRLNAQQVMYHFLSGYTAKVAGTETGITEPTATFSTCFAAPFLPRHPARYAAMLDDRLRRHGSQVWLVNTGWTGGPHGTGSRIKLAYTRAMVRAILDGQLDNSSCHTDPIFGVCVPNACPDVPSQLLRPRDTWSDPAAYDEHARRLAALFRANFTQFAGQLPATIAESGPRA